MGTQFTPCPACGAVGEVGKKCPFCGTLIILKENIVIFESRIVAHRTITAQQYAEKISIYHKVRHSPISSKLIYVSIGDEKGIINLNAELVYPLQRHNVMIISDTTLLLHNCEHIYKKNGEEICLHKYLNLETMEEYDGIEHDVWKDRYYKWESFRCKGKIDLTTGNIISPPSDDRMDLLMSKNEYFKYKKEQELRLKKEKEEQELRLKKENRRKKNICNIIYALCVCVIVILLLCGKIFAII